MLFVFQLNRWEDLESESAILASTLIFNTMCDAVCLHLADVLPGCCLCAAVHDDNLGNNLPVSCELTPFCPGALPHLFVHRGGCDVICLALWCFHALKIPFGKWNYCFWSGPKLSCYGASACLLQGVMECSGSSHVPQVMWMVLPNQAASLQGSLAVK